MTEFFSWVGDASPWLWLALGITLMAVEILAPSFVLVWPGLAAMVMAVLTWLFPGFSGQALVAVFAVLSIGLMVAGRMLVKQFAKEAPPSTLNARGQSLIGREAKVVSVSGAQGKVEVDGVQWPTTWEASPPPEPGQWVEITQSSGVILRAVAKKR